ncbi:YrzI family small protein [Fictibacillus fluitans]|uniref:YrzI family small protein n=1 Tax=Fictibacillus fluitans TaxID=3058422 RepID=A0ABT8HZU6_9BACL|nr:YrzI family small protein [Fictibacillus sp. NE201]MDN4526304.1 YrzI family small protein [Fictibacillus sp. NE201]
MLTLNLFFGTLTISLRKNERTYKEYVHQQNVNEMFEAAHNKAREANYIR